MKRLFLSVLFFLFCLTAFAQQIPQVSPSELEPHGPGFIRKAPGCSTGDTCTGSNPPIFQLTPDMCGTVISTGGNKNTDGSTSTDGYRYNLPTVAALAAAGYTGTGATMASGYSNRSGQCSFGFVEGVAGSAVGFVRIGIDGVQNTDRVTFIYEGAAHDMSYGDIAIPAAGGAVYVTWNGTSWFAMSGAPVVTERFGHGQMAAHGQGRLFRVTADPSWWTVGSKIGSLAYCPVQGVGLNINNNGINALGLIPPNCAFVDTASGSLLYWIQIRQFQSFGATGIAQGAAYGAGTAPDGTAFGAGNYIVLTGTSTVSLASGDTVTVHNMPTTLGSITTGKWIAKLLTAPTTGCASGTCIELHEKITEAKSPITSANNWIGPPSSFVAGDTLRSDYVSPVVGSYTALTALSTSGGTITRFTNPVNGAEFDITNGRTIVGLARTVSTAFVSTGTTMYVASAFNPMEATAVGSYPSNRTFTNTVTAEISSLGRANFVYYNDTSSIANSLGDQGRGVRWVISISASNNTNGDGCQFGASFDGGAVETQVGKFVNPAGTNGEQYPITFSGNKLGLSELSNNPHYITIFGNAVTGGTCTVDSTATSVTAFPWQ